MVPFPIPPFVAQATSAVYGPIKDLFLYLKGEKKEVEDLNDKLTALIRDVVSIKSRKKKIDDSLQHGFKEKSDEYRVLEQDIATIFAKFIKFMTKSKKISSGLPKEFMDKIKQLKEKKIKVDELDVSTAMAMIEQLQETEPKIITCGFFKLAELSRDIEKLNKRASPVLDRLQKPDNLVVDKKFEEVVAQGQGELLLPDDNEFPGISKYVNKVLEDLKENEKVGITGKFGVGKSTVMEKLYHHLIRTMSLSDRNSIISLDGVILTTYPKSLAKEEEIIETIQEDIMLKLGIIEQKTKSIEYNAARISAFLHQKKYVVLIDDVALHIDLNKLGLQESHQYRKVVIASLINKVINKMTDKHEEIQPLSTKNSWKLFENICGEIPKGRIRDIAETIIECCEGLPQQIKLIARNLKGAEDEDTWEGVLQSLQSDTEFAELLGLGGICGTYKKYYEDLRHDFVKKCSLYGALFPTHHEIHKDYLIECWMAERFIDKDADQRLRLTRDHGKIVLDTLTGQHLLEYCPNNKYVKMPLNFRRVAQSLKYPGEENCVIWVPMRSRNPDEKIWNTATKMSLIDCKSKLPESPKCGNICTLLLQSMHDLKRLADNFFDHMKKLQVLDLQRTKIKTLPGSIKWLVCLRSLYLNHCRRLSILPSDIAKLTKLELLDICGTSLPSLPEQIKSMVELRCLRASFLHGKCNHNSKGKQEEVIIIPKGIIKELQRLEELSIDIQCSVNNADELAIEMASLKYLTTLHFNFPSISSFNTFVTQSKSLNNIRTGWKERTLRSFNISIGSHETEHPSGSDVSVTLAERRLRFSTNGEICSVTKVLKQASSFEIIKNKMVKTLPICDLDALQACVIKGCSGLRNIVDRSTIDDDMGDAIVEGNSTASGVLQNLKRLHLYDLHSLECIWEGSVLHQSLIQLTVLTLNGCHKLTKIFDPALARALSSLKHLKVENCDNIAEIVEVPQCSNSAEQENLSEITEIVESPEAPATSADQEDLSNILNNVEMVELSNLPQLQTLCGNNTSVMWNALKDMVIMRCQKLSKLSLTVSNAEKLTSIECEGSWWIPLALADDVKNRLNRFCCFKEESSSTTIGEGSFSHQGPSNIDSAGEVISSDDEEGSSVHQPAPNIDAEEETPITVDDPAAYSYRSEEDHILSTDMQLMFDDGTSNVDLQENIARTHTVCEKCVCVQCVRSV